MSERECGGSASKVLTDLWNIPFRRLVENGNVHVLTDCELWHLATQELCFGQTLNELHKKVLPFISQEYLPWADVPCWSAIAASQSHKLWEEPVFSSVGVDDHRVAVLTMAVTDYKRTKSQLSIGTEWSCRRPRVEQWWGKEKTLILWNTEHLWCEKSSKLSASLIFESEDRGSMTASLASTTADSQQQEQQHLLPLTASAAAGSCPG